VRSKAVKLVRQRLLILAVVVFFLATTFRYGWTRSASDFPNYYTAAVLVRQGQPLHKYYDWTWFQRQMRYAGLEQLGGYLPQTPLSMLPLVPVAGFPVQTAKRIWLTFSLGCLIATIFLLSRITRFKVEQITLLAIVGYPAIHINFLYGQYYVFVLFLLTLAFYCLQREQIVNGGLLLGSAFALKLYGGPFILYLTMKRRWRALAAMVGAALCLVLVATSIFGWRDIAWFGTQILPRALEGQTLDPYNSLNGTLSTLLRRSLMREPELNPGALWNAPAAFFFLQPLLILGIIVFPLIALSGSNRPKRDFAWFVVVLLLASPNTGSYTFLLLLLPTILLLEEANLRSRVFLIVCYGLLALPLQPAWSWLFPKVWLLLSLFFWVGREYWHLIRPKAALTAAVLIIVASGISAARHLTSYSQEPAQHWERIVVHERTLLSLSPAIIRSGLVYQTIGRSRYILRWLHQDRITEFRFDGDAIQPVAESADGPIRFELLIHRRSRFMLLDPATGRVVCDARPEPHAARLGISPDGKWIAATRQLNGTDQIWLQPTAGGTTMRLTGGNCNSSSAVWELNSKAIVFVSDCGRGIGWPALYRANLETIQKTAWK